MGYSLSKATLIALCSQLAVSIGIPISGYIADYISPHKLYRSGLLATAISFPCIYMLASTGSMPALIIGVSIYAITNAWLSGPMMAIVQNEFPTLIRYRGISFAWGVAIAIFGGTALMIAQWMQDTFHQVYACGLYVSLSAIVTYLIVSYLTPKDTFRFALQN